MPVINRLELWDQLKRRELAPIYVLFGSERRLLNKAVSEIADHAFADTDLRDFNETEYSLNTDGNLKQALADANQLPMMSERRVIRVTEVRISMSGIRDTVREEHEPLLKAYFADPSPSTVLIFVADELNGVRKMGKMLRAECAAVEFAPLNDQEMHAYARRKVTETGSVMDDATLRYLLSVAESDVFRIENEINKISTAALPDKRISPELVERLVPSTREISNFDLASHLIARDKPAVMRTLAKILDDGAEPLMLLGLISYNFRRLAIAKDLMARGIDRNEIGRALNMRHRELESFLGSARRADPRRLLRILGRIAHTDLAIKTSLGGGTSGSRMQIEMLVCDLAAC